jgi:hypothetical protein
VKIPAGESAENFWLLDSRLYHIASLIISTSPGLVGLDGLTVFLVCLLCLGASSFTGITGKSLGKPASYDYFG